MEELKRTKMAPKVSPPINQKVSNTSGKHAGKASAIINLKLEHPEMSEAKIAAVVGCDPSNVHRVIARFRTKYSSEQLADFQESKAEVYDALQLRALGSITDEDLANASVRDKAVAAGIWEDKARTIRGQATQINVSVLLDAVQAAKSLQDARSAEAMAAVRKRLALDAQVED